jgi:hypothetical protein
VAGPLSLLAAPLSLFGGILQAGNIRRQTELKLEQMRRRAAQEIGLATAQAGASGVEMESGTVQKHLADMQTEWSKRMYQLQSDGNEAASMSILSSAGSAFGSLASGFGGLGETLQNANDAFKAFDATRAQANLDALPKTTRNPISYWGD